MDSQIDFKSIQRKPANFTCSKSTIKALEKDVKYFQN